MKLDSEHLEILAVIVEKGGLTEGAEALGKSQPSVSRSMALFEERIGMPLFEPGRRPLRPTELGADLARLGARIRVANQEASLLVRRYRQGHAGRLRIGGSPIFMDGVVATMIADFQSQHPDVQIEQSYGYLDTLGSRLRNGALDVAVLPLDPAQTPQGLSFTPLMPGNNVIACRAGHPLARRTGITLTDIEPWSWIAPPLESPLYRDLQRAMKSIGCDDFRVTLSGGSLAAIQSVMAGSDSLTVLPYSVVFLSRQTMPLAALPLKIDHASRHLGLLVDPAVKGPPALRHFVNFLTTAVKRLQDRIDHDLRVTQRRG